MAPPKKTMPKSTARGKSKSSLAPVTESSQAQFLLRIPTQLKEDLQREADGQGRKLTQEINIRLRESLKQNQALDVATVPINYTELEQAIAACQSTSNTLNLRAAGAHALAAEIERLRSVIRRTKQESELIQYNGKPVVAVPYWFMKS